MSLRYWRLPQPGSKLQKLPIAMASGRGGNMTFGQGIMIGILIGAILGVGVMCLMQIIDGE